MKNAMTIFKKWSTYTREKDKNKNFIKGSILFILFLDILSFGILIPLLPELKNLYQVNNSAIAFWLIIYEICAFFSAPILGQLSDYFWRKKLLLLCILGNVASRFILILSKNYLFFILARLVNGITGGNISIIKSIGIDISPSSKEKKSFFSYFWALFGLAFVIGPFFWGILLPYGYQAPFLLALILNSISFFLVALFLPETGENSHIAQGTHNKKQETTDTSTIKQKLKNINFNTFWKIFEVFQIQNIRPLLLAITFLFLWYFSFQSVISLFLDSSFNVSGKHIAYILSGIWILTAINQLFLIKNFWLKYFSDKKISIIIFYILLLTTGIIAIQVDNLIIVVIGITVLSFFYTTLPPIFSTALVEHYDKNKVGEINGVTDSILTLMIVITLWISSLAIDYWYNIFFFSLGFFIVAWWFSNQYFKKQK